MKLVSYLNTTLIDVVPSMSPRRAQALVDTTDNHQKRMVINYSNTINFIYTTFLYTLLDAYPLTRINDIVTKVEVFSYVDLKVLSTKSGLGMTKNSRTLHLGHVVSSNSLKAFHLGSPMEWLHSKLFKRNSCKTPTPTSR